MDYGNRMDAKDRALHHKFSTSLQHYLQATLGMELHKSVSIPRVFLRTASAFRDRPALHDRIGEGYQGFTYGELLERVQNFAAALLHRGLGRQSAVAVFMKNQSAWAVSDLGILFAGCLTVPIYETLSAGIIELILDESETRLIVVENRERYEKIASIWPKLARLETVVVVHPEGVERREGVLDLAEFLAEGREARQAQPDLVEQAFQQIERDDLASIVYTSGTTGRPKGVMLTHKNFLSNFYGILSLTDVSHTDRLLSILPLAHVLERTAGHFTPLLVGASIYYAESIKTIAQDIAVVQPTICIAVPRVFEKIYASLQEKVAGASRLRRGLFAWAVRLGERIHQVRSHAPMVPASDSRFRHRPEDYAGPWSQKLPLRHRLLGGIAERLVYRKIWARLGGKIRYMISGGAALSGDIISFFRNLGIVIYEGYGLTETSPIVAFNYHVHYEPGTVGHLLPYVDVRFSEQDEILIKGPNVMRGYYKNPEATREVLDEGGWFHSGDVGCFTERNNLRITGRIKDIIVTSGGKNIPINPIESAIAQSDLVSYAVLIGDGWNFISCLIFPEPENLRKQAQKLGLREQGIEALCVEPAVLKVFEKLIDEVNAPLSKYERIKKFKLVPRELTIEGGDITPTLKLKRKEILRKFKDEIEAIYKGG